MIVYAPTNLLLPLQVMRKELEANRLEVGLSSAPEQRHVGHGVRVLLSQNPEWYRELCAEHPSTRKDNRLDSRLQRTKIKRRHVLRILGRLCAGKGSCSKWVLDLFVIASSMLTFWEEEEQEYAHK